MKEVLEGIRVEDTRGYLRVLDGGIEGIRKEERERKRGRGGRGG